MRFTLFISALLIQQVLFSQTNQFIKLSGHAYGHRLDSVSMTSLDNCTITLMSSTGSIRETKTDTFGFYSFDSISTKTENHELKIERKNYFGVKSKIGKGVLHDTVIDFLLTEIPALISWLPEIYFNYNSSLPIDSSMAAIKVISKVLTQDTTGKMTITSYKDSLESNDILKDRATFVYNELIKLGIEKSRLQIEFSSEPNIFKNNQYYRNDITGEIDFIVLTEKYISNSSIEKQSSLRQLNQCVAFKIKR